MRRAVALLGASLVLALPVEAKIEKAAFGETPEHQKVDLYTLTNASGMTVKLSTYGAVIQSLAVPDRAGKLADIVRGFDSLDGYLAPGGSHIGAVIGRYANRIRGAQFVLEGTTYRLIANNGPNTLHGGPLGFDKQVWTAQPKDGASPSLTLSYLSRDGEQNYPGTLKVTVTYTLQADNGSDNARGYDHAFVIRGEPGTLRLAARVEEPMSGRVMEVLTTQPGAQLYTANSTRPVTGKGGAQYTTHGAFCIETEHHPDSPNHSNFPSSELKPGETFHETTVFRFPKPR